MTCGQVSLGSDAKGHRGWVSPCCNSREQQRGREALILGDSNFIQIGVEILLSFDPYQISLEITLVSGIDL